MPQLTRRGFGLLAIGATATTFAAARSGGGPDYGNPRALYAALREQPGRTLTFSTGEIRLVFADGAPGLDRALVERWVGRAAAAISTYFGRFPIRQMGLLVIARPGNRIGHATTYGFAGAATRIHVGIAAGQDAFDRDWVLVHEMIHAALPDLPRRALWLQEGSATWVEPVSRAQAGQLAAGEVWREAAEGLPKGQPGGDAAGMDGTDRWGRLYWGGAGFWLMAEIDVWSRTGGRFLLRDALRAISQASGGNRAMWTPEQMMRVGDAAIAANALSPLYQRFADRPVTLDLPGTFALLGMSRDGAPIDGTARLAALRRKITRA